MKTLLIEAPRPNSTFAKYNSQFILPNILCDIAGSIKDKVAFQNELKNRAKINLGDFDRYIVNISEVVEKTHKDKEVVTLLKDLQDRCFNIFDKKEVFLSGWYSWIKKAELEQAGFKVTDYLFYEKSFNDSLKSPADVSPTWDLIDWAQVPKINGKIRATLRTSRGCLNKCIMCPVNLIYKNKMYVFPLDWVKEQITILYKNYNVREINFIDDNFLFSDKRTIELLTWLAQNRKSTLKGLSYMFHEGMEVRTALNEDVVKLLKEAGFHGIKLGVESFNKATLEYIKKPYSNPDDAIKAIQMLQKYKLNPTCFICLGFPTDTEESIKKDIKILKDLKAKVRCQILYSYSNNSNLTKSQLLNLQNEMLEVCGSNIWKKDKKNIKTLVNEQNQLF